MPDLRAAGVGRFEVRTEVQAGRWTAAGRHTDLVRLPERTRQVVRTEPGGRVYLDVEWRDVGLVVEIDGAQHLSALNPVDDALRENELTLGRDMVLRLPVLGLRLAQDAFMGQVVRAHRMASERAA